MPASRATTSLAPAHPAKPAASKDWLRALELSARMDADPSRTLPLAIDELAERQGDAPALLSDRESLSFRALAERSRRYARWALDQGLGKGEIAALLMPNRPEYLAIWLGLSRVGAIVALLNPQLRGASLAHCIAAAAPRCIIVDAGLAEALAETSPGPAVWTHGAADAPWPRIDLAVETYTPEALGLDDAPAVALSDRALLIYTSGTTGLPKAANVSHRRVMNWSAWFAGLLDIQPSDRLYDCLPLCHSAGGVAAVGAALLAGASTVVAEKFSASRFWADIRRWDCTLFQYIGELCRYLLAAPSSPDERSHALRLCCGNGLSGEVWEAFQ
ncbi:MAG: AMP-binding protein, partial [Caulobacteraceae bacterium]